MSAEFYEPWQIHPRAEEAIVDDRGVFVAATTAGTPRRIVACVNALAGIPTETIERMRPERWRELVRECMAELQFKHLPDCPTRGRRDGCEFCGLQPVGEQEFEAFQKAMALGVVPVIERPERTVELDPELTEQTLREAWANGCAETSGHA